MTQKKSRKLQTLIEGRQRLLQRMEGLSEMVDGSIVQIFRRCGKAGCKCETGEKHGPAWALLYKNDEGRTQMVYIGRGGLTEARRRRKMYDQFKALTKKILDVNRQILKIHLAERKKEGNR